MVRRIIIAMLVVGVSLAAAWPVAAARRVTVDVLVVVDTSDSMTDELDALCAAIDPLVDDLDRRGVTVRPVVLGIAETRACADLRVTRLIAGGETQEPEDWGPAIVDLATRFEWTPDAVRLIVPVSDEGPLGGDPVNSQDDRAIRDAVRAAQAAQVVVSPVLGTESNAEMAALARDLAEQTGGRVFETQKPADDLRDGLRDLVWRAVEPARKATSLLEAIPTPRDIVFDGRVLSANLVFALLMTLVLGVASVVLDNTVDDNRESFGKTRLGLLVAAGRNVFQAVERALAPGEWTRLPERARRWLAAAQVAGFLVLTALLAVLLQPGLSPLTWRGAAWWVGALLALALVTALYEGARHRLARRAGITPVLHLRPGGLLATALSLLISRLFGILPGFFYPRATESVAPEAAPGRQARITLAALTVTGAAGLLLWGLTLPTAWLLEVIADLRLSATLGDVADGVVRAVQGFFALGFFFAWQVLFFELLPLAPSAGNILFRHSRLLWAAAGVGVLWVLLHLLVNPFGTLGEWPDNPGLLLLGLALLLYSALAVGVWLFFTLRASEMTRDWGRSQRTTVLAISLVVLWVLGGCAGLVTLAGRLF